MYNSYVVKQACKVSNIRRRKVPIIDRNDFPTLQHWCQTIGRIQNKRHQVCQVCDTHSCISMHSSTSQVHKF